MMQRLAGRRKTSYIEKYPDIQVYHNFQFHADDVTNVFFPIFGRYYASKDLLSMIYSANNKFCAYNSKRDQCIACALVNIASNNGVYIMLFGVAETNQGRGTGTYLLRTIIDWAYRTGYKYLSLHVHVLNHKAIGLYEKVGFKKQQYLPRYYGTLPKYPPDAYQMILYL